MIYTLYDSPIGQILLLSENSHLTGLYFHTEAAPLPAQAEFSPASPVLEEASRWLDAYFRGDHPDASALPLRPEGTAFQLRVWQQLLQIPYGSTVTYGQLAKQFSVRMSAQAIGQAVAKNPISILIPCHRVMGAENRVTGYAGGISRKVWLLRHEGNDTGRFQFPKNYRGK